MRSGAPRRRRPRDTAWIVIEPIVITQEEKARIKAEDAEIQRRRELFPLH